MLERFGRFFNRNHHCPEGLLRDLDSLNLLDDVVLHDFLARLSDLDEAERYPLQLTFYEKLLGCDLLLPIPEKADLSKGLPILALENGSGEKGVPVFTDESAMANWVDETTDYVGLPFPALCRYAVEAGGDYIVINLGGPFGCEISFHDFSYLAEGFLPPPRETNGEIVIEKNTPMRLAACTGLSDMLMDRLGHIFRTHGELINQVYLFNVAFNDGPFQPALGIRMPDGMEVQWEMALWPNMQAVLHEMLERREVVNVFLLNESGSMEAHVRDLAQPIYVNPC